MQKYEKFVFSHHFSIATFLRKLKAVKLMIKDSEESVSVSEPNSCGRIMKDEFCVFCERLKNLVNLVNPVLYYYRNYVLSPRSVGVDIVRFHRIIPYFFLGNKFVAVVGVFISRSVNLVMF